MQVCQHIKGNDSERECWCAVQSASQWESVPVGSEEVTEAVDFWLVNAGGASAAACSSSSSTSAGGTLREKKPGSA